MARVCDKLGTKSLLIHTAHFQIRSTSNVQQIEHDPRNAKPIRIFFHGNLYFSRGVIEYIFRGMSLRRFNEFPYPVQQFSYSRLRRNIGHEDFNHFEKFLALVSCSDLQGVQKNYFLNCWSLHLFCQFAAHYERLSEGIQACTHNQSKVQQFRK